MSENKPIDFSQVEIIKLMNEKMPISELEHYLKNQNQYTHEKFELRHA